MSTHTSTGYSRYADAPVDRDLARVADELRALPTPRTERATSTRTRESWLRRHLHLRPTHA